jgi:hypothetical protein
VNIDFPNKGLLKGTKVGDYQVSAQGRNGYMKQAGLEVFWSPAGIIRLSPVTSKGLVGNCIVEIPNDPEVIKKVVAALQTPPEDVKPSRRTRAGAPETKYEKIQARIEEHRGEWDFEDETYPRSDWMYEVGNNDTQLGYFDWLIHKYEAAEEGGN